MKFTYKAEKSTGEFYEAEREATDKYALAHELAGSGETLLSAVPAKEKSSIDFNHALDFLGRISLHDKVVFARSLGGMLGAGLPISRALAVLERQTRNAKLKKVATSLLENISSGKTLSQALETHPKVFSSLFISMVKAGEEGGNLGTALVTVSEQLDRAYLLRRKIRGAMMYPSIVMFVMFVIGILMFIFIVPELVQTFKELNANLPRSTKVVIWISDVLKNHAILGLLILAGLFAGGWTAIKSKRGRRMFDFAVLRIPVVAPIVREANAARTGQALSSLLSSGVEAVQALTITAETLSNSYYKEVLFSAREAIKKGETMSSVFRAHEDIFPPALPEMMAVGEETGKLSVMLKEIGNFFEEEVDQKTKNLSTVIEPALMVIVGVAVGFFAIAMISPMYSLMNSI